MFFFSVIGRPQRPTLSLHDALPISFRQRPAVVCVVWWFTGCEPPHQDRKSTRLNSSHDQISYAVFCLKKKIVTVDTWFEVIFTRPHNVMLYLAYCRSVCMQQTFSEK